jgi:hypothetical protein
MLALESMTIYVLVSYVHCQDRTTVLLGYYNIVTIECPFIMFDIRKYSSTLLVQLETLLV